MKKDDRLSNDLINKWKVKVELEQYKIALCVSKGGEQVKRREKACILNLIKHYCRDVQTSHKGPRGRTPDPSHWIDWRDLRADRSNCECSITSIVIFSIAAQKQLGNFESRVLIWHKFHITFNKMHLSLSFSSSKTRLDSSSCLYYWYLFDWIV